MRQTRTMLIVRDFEKNAFLVQVSVIVSEALMYRVLKSHATYWDIRTLV